jgi:hypothetical protein
MYTIEYIYRYCVEISYEFYRIKVAYTFTIRVLAYVIE